MAEVVKVVNGLKCHKEGVCCNTLGFVCPYWEKGQDCSRELITDTLSVIEEKQKEIDKLTEQLEKKCEICANKMLKAEPRVMTFCEVYNLEPEVYFVDFRGNIAVYVALADRHDKVTIGDYVPEPRTVFIGEDHMFVVKDSDYGKRWRCWTARPSKEQREAEPWKEL